MTTAGKPAAATPSSLGPAADRLRESARWLVIAFGAVAAVVFAGIGIAGFGSVDPDTAPAQFWTALLGAAAALLGVLGALLVAMSLAAASTVSVAELCEPAGDRSMRAVRAELAHDPVLAPWGNDVQRFFAQVGKANTLYHDRMRNWAATDEVSAYPDFANRASDRVSSLTRVQNVVLETASYLRLRNRFARARWWIFVFLGLAATGATAFVWATGAAATESVPAKATTATWTVPDDDRDVVRRRLGTGCTYDLDEIPVVILGEQGGGAETDVVSASSRTCDPVRLVVGTRELVRDR